MTEFLSTLFSRASRFFSPKEMIAGDHVAILNENSKVGVYLEKVYGVSAEVFNLESLIEWFKAYGKDTSVAFIDMIDLINGDLAYGNLATMKVLSSTNPHEKELCALVFRISKELDDWRMKFGYKFSPQQFRRFLQNRRLEFNDSECHLFEAMCNLNMSVNREYELEDDGGVDRKIHFQVKKGADFTVLPREFNLQVPMLFGDSDDFSIPVELKFELPTEHNGNKPSFVMSCEFLDRLMIERVKACVAEFEEQTNIKALLGRGYDEDVTPEYKRVLGA